MEIELTHVFDATPEQLWEILLDPVVMAGCVPGTQNVEVLSPVEYAVQLKVKIAFIKARFNISVRVTESDPPRLLRCQTAGEDKSVASSVKSENEMVLTPLDGGGTELRAKSVATVFGRLGTLGLNPMRTKAERMWAEFCTNIEAIVDPATQLTAEADQTDGQQPETVQAQAAASSAPKPTRRLLQWPRRQAEPKV